MPSARVLDRFMSKVVWNGDEDECWIWAAYVRPSGYGEFWLDGEKRYAHRVSYELFVGPIPDELQIDHVRARGCTSRACVNPAHLEPVTMQENLDRGEPGNNVPQTFCKRGHLLTPDNVYRQSNGGKLCRRCTIDRSRARRNRLAAEAGRSC